MMTGDSGNTFGRRCNRNVTPGVTVGGHCRMARRHVGYPGCRCAIMPVQY